VKRVYKQTILDDDGKVYATRTLEFNEEPEVYRSPIFQGALLRQEDEFLAEMFEVTTEVVE
jgi:hypothetical protein